jgi:hypothetical protein
MVFLALVFIPISLYCDVYFIEKANGIKYLYAWLDRHPHECVVGPFIDQIREAGH